MKYFTSTIIAVCSSVLLSGQITVDSSDLYTSPDTINVVKTTNAGALDIKTSGSQTWDFRSLKADSVQQILIRDLDNGNPVDNKFKNANMVLERPGEGNAYLFLSRDSLTVDGFADFQFDANLTADVDLDPNLKLMSLPISYTDTFSTYAVIDSTQDTVIRQFGIQIADSIRVVAELSQFTECDAYGPLQTIQNIFNTIRLRTVETQTTTIYFHQPGASSFTQYGSPTVETIHRYTWLAKNRGYQVAEVTTDDTDQNILTAQFTLIDSLYGYIDNQSNPNCYGEANGSASFKTIIGSNFYTYNWSTSAGSQQTATATGLKAGTHTVTVSDVKSGATFTDTVVLTNPDSLVAQIVSFTNESDSGKDGSIEAAVSGGTPPYTFAWDRSNSNIGIAENLEGGVHKVTIKDSKGCTKVLEQELTSTVGIASLETKSFKVFPNPVKGFLFIDGLLESTDVSIIDITGHEIIRTEVGPSQPINMEQLGRGMYLVQFTIDNQTKMHRIIKE